MQKNIFVLMILIIFTCSALCAQTIDSTIQKSKYDLYIDLGFKTVPFDYYNGISIGFSVFNPDKRLSVGWRKDMVGTIGRTSVPPGGLPVIGYGGYLYDDGRFVISNYNSYTTVYAEYKPFAKKDIYTNIGISKIYIGDGARSQGLITSEDYGALALGFAYKFTWFRVELRADIPMSKLTYSRYNDPTIYERRPAQIMSCGIVYKFKPKNPF